MPYIHHTVLALHLSMICPGTNEALGYRHKSWWKLLSKTAIRSLIIVLNAVAIIQRRGNCYL